MRIGITTYQMVPVNGSRPMLVRVSGGQVVILSRDPNICNISVAPRAPGSSVVLDHQVQTERDLILHGRSEGRTELLAADVRGNVLDRLTVSVKRERLVTYNLHCLQDLRRKTTRTLEDLDRIMLTVERVYLRQLNVRLRKADQRRTTFVANDLGDPINVSVPLTPLGTNVREVIAEKIEGLGMNTLETINFVSTWNLVDRRSDLLGFTPDLGAICLVEVHDDILNEANTYAHELGHALGLLHDLQPPSFLMNGLGQFGFQVTGVDIDRVNGSGARFRTP